MKEQVQVGKARALRVERKTYTDGMESSDEDEENLEQTLDLDNIYETKVYPPYFVKTMLGEDVTVELLQRTGLKCPIFVVEKTGLNMRVPDSSFTITDVKNLVGGRRIIEVMNSATQSNAEMTMKDWEEFFIDPDRDDTKLNCISLEISNTKLAPHVICPRVVRQIDFGDNTWPRHLKEAQDDPTNDMAKMCYPKVQKYCLMTIGGCFTDFHVDLGGTSVWYHLLKGEKVFWLIPPTPTNLKTFEQWTMSGKQSNVFFGDLVPKCCRITLVAGNTFFIPSGWIHAVYTPKDSLVMGGNFLHAYAIERQLRIAQCEETLKVPHKHRYPFFTEMMWYVLDKYCYALLGRHHLDLDDALLVKLLGTENERKVFQDNIGHPHLTPEEVRGLKSIVLYLHSLPGNKKNVPSILKDPVSLIRDIRTIVEVHKNDKQERAITGRPLLYWPGIKSDPSNWYNKSRKRKSDKAVGPAFRQMVEGVKMLGVEVVCDICGLDGWWLEPHIKIERHPSECGLRECRVCCQVVHPFCLPDVGLDGREERVEGVTNLWTCPQCVQSPRPPARINTAGTEVNTETLKEATSEPPIVETVVKKEVETESTPSNLTDLVTVKEEPQAYDDECEPVTVEDSTEMEVDAEDLDPVTSTKSLSSARVSACLERIGQIEPKVREAANLYSSGEKANLAESDMLLIPCLSLLTSPALASCRQVSRAWLVASNKVATQLGRKVDLTEEKLNSHLLSTVVRRQPTVLRLDRTGASKQQLSWLLPKLPSVTNLSLVGLDSTSVVSALNTSGVPNLTFLDLSHVMNLSDSSVCLLLRPKDGKKSTLSSLQTLRVSSTEVTDISLRYIGQYLPLLTCLAVSNCMKLTDAGLVQLGDQSLPISSHLSSLDIRGCPMVTDLVHLTRCINLSRIYYERSGVGMDTAQKFVHESNNRLAFYQGSTIALAGAY